MAKIDCSVTANYAVETVRVCRMYSDCPKCIGDEYCWHEPLDGGATGKAVE